MIMIFVIVFSLLFAIACLCLAVFTEAYFFLIFTVLSLLIFGVTYSSYNKQKHPEEYKRTNNFNTNARIVANGSKAGIIITTILLAVMVVIAIILFVGL